MVEADELRMPRIDHCFKLSQIDEALKQSASKRTVGKAVLECSGEPLKVVAFWGSARAASFNAGLVRCAHAAAPKANIEVTLIDVSGWPMFNVETEQAKEVPAEVLAACQLVYDCDAVLMGTPEYNFGNTPITTNAVAWLSRKLIEGYEVPPLRNKPCGLMSAGGGQGGARAQQQCRDSFTQFLKMPTMAEPKVCVSLRAKPFPFDKESGDLTCAASMAKVDEFLAAFRAFVAEAKAGSAAEEGVPPWSPRAAA